MISLTAQCINRRELTNSLKYSLHSNSHGFACDVVENWETVLADGSVVNANARKDVNLCKVQRGTSGNVRLVTRIIQRVSLKHTKPTAHISRTLALHH